MDEEQFRHLKYVLRPILWEWMDNPEYHDAVSAESFIYNSVMNYLRDAITEVVHDEQVWDEFMVWVAEGYTPSEQDEIGGERLRELYNAATLEKR